MAGAARSLQDAEGSRLSRRRYSCAGGASAEQTDSGAARHYEGMSGFRRSVACEKEEGETALGSTGRKSFLPAEQINGKLSVRSIGRP